MRAQRRGSSSGSSSGSRAGAADDDYGEPAGLPGQLDPARIDRGRLAEGTVALRTVFLGRELVTVSDLVPPGETAAVVRHLRGCHPNRCYGPRCGVGRFWSDAFPSAIAHAPRPLSDAI